MPEKWYLGKDRSDSIKYRTYDFLCSLQPGELFIKKYPVNNTHQEQTLYALMKRTKCRTWNPMTGTYLYTVDKIHLYNMECFYENYFGVMSNKMFSSLVDPELNMITIIYVGKDANEMLMMC